MPVYNGEKYVREALDSLLNQSFCSYELIISDNSSTDNTEEICREYQKKDKRIKYYRQQNNLGALANFQFVLDNANCEYFMWAACDDRWDVKWLEVLYSNLVGREGCAAFGRVQSVDEKGAYVDHLANNRKFKFSGKKLWRRVAFFLQFEGKGKSNLFYSLFRKENIESVDLITYNADFLTLFDLLSEIEFLVVGDVCLYKRIHEGSDGVVIKKSIAQKLIDLFMFKTLRNYLSFTASYYNYASAIERIILLLFSPVKLLLMFWGRFLSLVRSFTTN
jgi:glycosyltransferase involved in cell wall biosynthesis